jgi:hypothetical protein
MGIHLAGILHKFLPLKDSEIDPRLALHGYIAFLGKGTDGMRAVVE